MAKKSTYLAPTVEELDLVKHEEEKSVASSSGRSSESQCAYTQLCQLFQNSRDEFNYEEAIRKFENTETALREKAVRTIILTLNLGFAKGKFEGCKDRRETLRGPSS